jgi:protease-4
MKRRLYKLFTVVGAFTTGMIALLVVVSIVRCAVADKVPDHTILELRLDRPVYEGPVDGIAALFGRGGMNTLEVIETLERAGDDDRVEAIIAYVGDSGSGMARVQEIRDAIARVRAKGKRVIAYAETFGELGPGNQSYYLATACDEIWLQPSGGVGLTGLMTEAMFVRGTLDLVGIEPRGDHRKEYKNALNMFTERRFTDAHREAAQTMIDDLFGQMVADIAKARGLEPESLRALIDEGPFLGQEALAHGLVDGLAYRDEVVAKLKEGAGEDAELLYAEPYRERAGRPWASGDKAVALVYGVGAVTRGPSGVDPLSGEQSMGSDTVTAAFRSAIADEDVVAIVFRVDSPGGSAVASDAIWRETQRAKDEGKPVIISMGNVAASGGYYVSAGATKILAEPSTLTGSIGVLGGKPYVRDAWNKIGVTWDEVHTSDNAAMWSTNQDYDEAEWARLQAWLDGVYVDFTGKVAAGRGLSAAQVETIARGRVWSGERALAHGLVDELGGLYRAIEVARAEAGIGDDEDFELREFPPSQGVFGGLFGDGPDSSEGDAVAAVRADLDRWRPALRRAAAIAGSSPEGAVLRMAPLEIGP